MWVNGVVVLHPSVDESEGGSGVWDQAYANVVALQGFDEGLGHTIALGAFDRGEARHQIERQGDLDGPVGGEDPESHCTGYGAPKRFSTQSTIMSRIISPETPAVVATQLMTSRS
jgi:hypothetical protein